LNHTDESFTNPDLGNCLDYTMHPEVNMQPNWMNYDLLTKMYGTVPNSNSTGSNSGSQNGSGGRRSLRGPVIPEWVRIKLQSLDGELGNHGRGREGEAGWRVLHEGPHLEAYELDLGESFVLQIYKVLVDVEAI
jgi:hypothetical protein